MPEHNSGSLAVYDLSIVFFLWHYRTRAWAFAVVIGFHLATWILFRIGIFPWLMIVSGLLFFPADWPRRLVRKWIGAQRVVERGSVREATERRLHPWGHVTLACYVVVQLYLPLRPYLQSESSAWTCQGFDWSWRVMLVEKSGYAEFRAFDPATGQRWRIGATDYLTPRQAQFMAQAPRHDPSLGPSHHRRLPGARIRPYPGIRRCVRLV